MIGVFVLLGGKANPVSANYFGDFLAFSASIFYAGFLLISYRLRDRYESSVIMFVSGFGSIITLGGMAAITEGIQVPSSIGELAPLIGLTLCLQVIGHNLLAHCQGKLNVNLSAIVCLCQPVIASIYSFFFFAEKLSLTELAGILLVILGVFSVKAQYTAKKTIPVKKTAE